MTTKEIADRVVALNRANDHETVYNEFYDENTVSIENWDGKPTSYVGITAIRKKAEDWFQNVVEIHNTTCSDALVADQSFAITFTMDITYKDMGRVSMTELAVYSVKDGKITKEEFQA